MRYFYIDTENVKSYEFLDSWNLTKDDAVVFFISENSRSIKFNELNKFLFLPSKSIFENVIVKEKNAMDFHMVAYLATNIVLSDKNDEHYIVSDDNGFYTAINYLQTKHEGVGIFIIKPDIDKTLLKMVNKVEGLNDLNNKINKSFGHDICCKIYPTYRHLFMIKKAEREKEEKVKTEELLFLNELYKTSANLRDFRNSLRKKYGNIKGSEMYDKNKKQFVDIKNKKESILSGEPEDCPFIELIIDDDLIDIKDILVDDDVDLILSY